MTRDMDQICTTVILGIAILLICMGYIEISKMKMSSPQSTCGKIPTTTKSVSAKASTMTEHKPHMSTPQMLNTIDGEWSIPVQENKKNEYEELKQDESELKKFFGEWEADAESTQKYMQAVPDQQQARKASNTRPISVDTEVTEPTNGRTLGLPGLQTMLFGSVNNIQFADSCVDFLQSDSYVSARKSNQKDCRM